MEKKNIEIPESHNASIPLENMASIFCQTCGEVVDGDEAIKSHLQLEVHQNSCGPAFAMKQMLLHCNICNIQVTGPEPFRDHINSKNHKKKESLQHDPNPKRWTCQVCQVSCTGPEPFQQHLLSRRHLREIRKRALLKKHELLLPSLSSPLPPPTPKTDALNCTLCSVTFHNSDSFCKHIETSGHKLALKNLDAASVEKQRPKSPAGNHQSIKVFNKESSVEIHEYQEPLKVNKESITLIALEDYIDNKEIHPGVANSSVDEISKSPSSMGVYECSVCKVDLKGFITYQKHLKGIEHKKNAIQNGGLQISIAPTTKLEKLRKFNAEFDQLLKRYDSDDEESALEKEADPLPEAQFQCTLCQSESYEKIQNLADHCNSTEHSLTIIRKQIAQNTGKNRTEIGNTDILHYIKNIICANPNENGD